MKKETKDKLEKKKRASRLKHAFMPDRRYQVIYCDPPWQFNNKKTGGSMKSGAESQYSVMSIDDLKNMPVADIADDNCVLVMWWVGSMPQEAINLVEAWGFTLKNMNGFVWNKITKNKKPHFGMGFYTRAGSESAIIAIKGKPKIQSHSVRAVRTAMIEEHSRKPAIFRDDIYDLCGDVLMIELFARERTEGWDVFGDQIDG